MKPEVYLDHLLEMRERGEHLPSAPMDDIAACLAVEEKLSELQEVPIPATFAHNLELSLRSRARIHNYGQQSDEHLSKVLPRSPGTAQNMPAQRATGRLSRLTALGIAAMLVLTFTIFITVVSQSLPPYTRQPPTNSSATEPATSVTNEINQLHSALLNLSQVVNDKHTDKAIQQALNIVVARTQSSQQVVEALPEGSERENARQKLHNVLDEENQTLYGLLKLVDWPMKLSFTQQLGELDNPVPQIKEITVQTRRNETLQVTLTGTHFAPEAKLIIDGKPGGSISRINAEQLIGIINHAEHFFGTHTLGVLNPDGTAAQIAFRVHHYGDDDIATPTSGY